MTACAACGNDLDMYLEALEPQWRTHPACHGKEPPPAPGPLPLDGLPEGPDPIRQLQDTGYTR